jgi:dTDP-glucose pyrophosphorylase
MAAGIGSRYGGLKQIDPVGPSGENIIDYSIFDAIRSGFGKIVCIIRRDIEEIFREKVGRYIEPRIETEYVFQDLDALPAGFSVPPGRTKPWGTGHAVLCAKSAVHGPAAVINADDFYGAAAFRSLSGWLAGANDSEGILQCCMVGYRLANTLTEHGFVARGICSVDAAGMLSGIVERTRIERFPDAVKYTDDGTTWFSLDETSIVSMNMWGFTPGFFAESEQRFAAFLESNIHNPKAEYFVPSVVNALVTEGAATVRVLPTNGQWFGVTYKEDRQRVKTAIRSMIDKGEYPEHLWQ